MKTFVCLLLCFVAGQSVYGLRKEEVSVVKDLFTKFADTQTVCKKYGTYIRCCAKDLLGFNLCLGLTPDFSSSSVLMRFTLNNRTFIKANVSAKQPPPICGAAPHLPVVKLCVEPKNVGFANETLNGCVDLSAQISAKEVARVSFKCIQLKENGDLAFVESSSSSQPPKQS